MLLIQTKHLQSLKFPFLGTYEVLVYIHT